MAVFDLIVKFQGLTKSLIDIPTTFENFSDPSQKEISAAVGYVVGFLLGMLPRFVEEVLLFCSSQTIHPTQLILCFLFYF